ncbi:helix-turn-helix protein [Pontibacter ummariensis]|uniref:Helix-turn-helix n=1 Tax=Pontibacter ummariensis TaxID=1610492 RepID=A0A239IG08_9BACT|nr:helix-turn-helix transcriptional regulator [Pontibacter ummariensis]PRY09819.1 helix-turn-helix protein [Pontibacter ummariensis]SNS92178.1 Helix-turn-helix [Pontibacter ummariensis]
MATDNIREKLNKITSKEPSKWMEDAKWRKDNKEWLKKSQAIALKVLRTLREKKMKQNELAKLLDVSDQQISKIVKGKENLTLETISKLEKALGIILFETPKERVSPTIYVPKQQFDLEIKSSKVNLILNFKTSQSEVIGNMLKQYLITGTLKEKAVTVSREERKAYPVSTVIYEPEENNNYKEAA